MQRTCQDVNKQEDKVNILNQIIKDEMPLDQRNEIWGQIIVAICSVILLLAFAIVDINYLLN
jgi:hypothetical protein